MVNTINLSINCVGGGSFEIKIIGQHILLSETRQYLLFVVICLAYSLVISFEVENPSILKLGIYTQLYNSLFHPLIEYFNCGNITYA